MWRKDEQMRHMTDELQKLLAGALSPEREAEVRAHCRSCEACGQALRESQLTWDLLETDTAPDPERPVWFALRQRRMERPHRMLRLGYAAASVATALVGVILGMQIGGITVAGADDLQTPEYIAEGTLFADETTFEALFSYEEVENGEETR
jgi:ferric-dicitrate binding protein FerR (iron transport regulator)